MTASNPTRPTRKTLAAPATVEGLGLFTGRTARCVIKPAEHGGIVFCRTDHAARPLIPAHIRELSSIPVHPAFAQIPPRHTALAAPDQFATDQSAADEHEITVYTTEHLLGALSGLGVTDALVELDAPELPIGDGSAALFVEAITSVGLADLPHPTEPIAPQDTVRVQSPDGSSTITAEPVARSEHASFAYELDYGPDAPIKTQRAEWAGDADNFAKNIAPARTFSLAGEAAQMRALGMFASFTPRDLLVIDDNGAPIDNAWQFDNEPARHKLLDLIGDLALTGRPIHAKITSTRGGHALNHAMAKALLGLS